MINVDVSVQLPRNTLLILQQFASHSSAAALHCKTRIDRNNQIYIYMLKFMFKILQICFSKRQLFIFDMVENNFHLLFTFILAFIHYPSFIYYVYPQMILPLNSYIMLSTLYCHIPYMLSLIFSLTVVLWLFSTVSVNFATLPSSYDDVIKWKHFLRYWIFVREFTGHRWIPCTKASDAELWCFLWSAPE